jgi:hypothetical protein
MSRKQKSLFDDADDHARSEEKPQKTIAPDHVFVVGLF